MTHDNSPATTEFVPVRPEPGAVVVTVLDGVTVLDAPDGQAIYRYDIPADGIVSGWASQALVDQIRQLQRTAEDRVLVDADPDVSHELLRSLSFHGLSVGDLVQPPGPSGRDEPDVPPTPQESPRVRSVLLTLGVAGAIVLGGVFYSLLAPTTTEELAVEPAAEPVTVDRTVAESSGTATPVPSVEPEGPAGEEYEEDAEGPVGEDLGAGIVSPEPPAPVLERYDVGPVSVATQPDSRMEVDGYWTTFTGADEAARYHVVVTPLAEAGGDQWWAIMDEDIADNPRLTHTGVVDGVLTYVEEPGDGSQSHWFMQTVGDHHVSLVCQTRSTRTPAQAEACADFVASMQG